MHTLRLPILALAGLIMAVTTSAALGGARVTISDHASRVNDPYAGYGHRAIVNPHRGVVVEHQPRQIVIERTTAQRVIPRSARSNAHVVTNPRDAAVQLYGPAILRHHQLHDGHTSTIKSNAAALDHRQARMMIHGQNYSSYVIRPQPYTVYHGRVYNGYGTYGTYGIYGTPWSARRNVYVYGQRYTPYYGHGVYAPNLADYYRYRRDAGWYHDYRSRPFTYQRQSYLHHGSRYYLYRYPYRYYNYRYPYYSGHSYRYPYYSGYYYRYPYYSSHSFRYPYRHYYTPLRLHDYGDHSYRSYGYRNYGHLRIHRYHTRPLDHHGSFHHHGHSSWHGRSSLHDRLDHSGWFRYDGHDSELSLYFHF